MAEYQPRWIFMMPQWTYTELGKLWLWLLKHYYVTEAARVESELARREKGIR
jgi:hypothetical protein